MVSLYVSFNSQQKIPRGSDIIRSRKAPVGLSTSFSNPEGFDIITSGQRAGQLVNVIF